MDDTKKAASALLELTQQGSTARTLMGKFRELLPAIETAQAGGVTHEKIVETLNAGGWDLKMATYHKMLYRLRNKKVKKYAGLPQDVPAMPAIQSTPGTEFNSTTKEKPASAEPQTSDAGDQVKSDALETHTKREQKSRQYISEGGNSLLNRFKKD